ncbi:MAG: murein biosynthesis integral membrane protein MurJ [Bacillota bacterium]|jgi:putative peptidoglycan lipid II flippase
MSIARAAALVLAMNLISRLLGFVRDAVIARQFGASGATDAYLVAYTVPYSLQAVLGMAFVTVMVPAITSYLVKGEEEEGWRVASSVFNGTGLVLAFFTILGLLFAPLLVRILAPGFEQEDLLLATRLTRIMLPSILFMGLGMMVTGVLNAHKRFGLPAFAPAFTNIIIILAVLLFGAGFGIEGLAAGTLAGFIGFLAVQLPGLQRIKMRYRFILDREHPAVRRVAVAVLPATFAVAVNQILLAMNRFFASGLAPGSITALDFGNRIMNLPLAIFAAAVSTVIFPTLAEAAAEKEPAVFSRTFFRGLRLVSLAILPAAVGLMVLREPVVRLLFQRGAFDAAATDLTAGALFYFSAGLWFLAANTLLTRAYYALEDLKTPVAAGLAAIGSNLLFSFIFLPVLGHQGLALANSLAAGVNAFLLFLLLWRQLPGGREAGLGRSLVKMLAASLLMGWLVQGFWRLVSAGVTASWWGEMSLLLAAAALGAAFYLLALLASRVEEAYQFLDYLKKKSMAKNK